MSDYAFLNYLVYRYQNVKMSLIPNFLKKTGVKVHMYFHFVAQPQLMKEREFLDMWKDKFIFKVILMNMLTHLLDGDINLIS